MNRPNKSVAYQEKKLWGCLTLTITEPTLCPFFLGSKAAVKLESLLLNRLFRKDVANLSTSHQTSGLEAFHSLILHFAPKHTAFSYIGMHTR